MDFYRDFWDYEPSEQGIIFIEDFSDWSNGGATAVPRNLVYITIAPSLNVFEVYPSNERIRLLMSHELVHIIAMDKANRQDKLFRRLFRGKVQQNKDHPISVLYAYLTVPRKFSPRWYHEGIAIFMETWMSGGFGRSISAYDEMVFRSLIKGDYEIYYPVGLESEGTAIDFQVGANSYLYGARFFSYLAYKHGPDKLIDWVSRTEGSNTYFSAQFRKIYDNSLIDEWSSWIDFEKKFQYDNLNRIKSNPVTEYARISDIALGSVSRSFYDKKNNRLIMAVRYPGQIAHIGSLCLETQKFTKIHDIMGASTYFASSIVFDEIDNKIYFTTNNFRWRDLNVFDLESNTSKRLIRNLRAGDFAMNPKDRSLWGVRHNNGIATLIRLKPPYKDYEAIYAYRFGISVYDLDISPEGNHLSLTMNLFDGTSKLVIYDIDDLLRGNNSYNIIFDFDRSSPANFVFSPDGRYLYGSSYYTGVSNIFRYDTKTESIEIMTNALTGFFRPLPIDDGRLISFVYDGRMGFYPVYIEDKPQEKVSAIHFLGQRVFEKYPFLENWNTSDIETIDFESAIEWEGNYDTLGNLSMISAYPIIEGYKDRPALGYRLDFADHLGFSRLNLSASYSISDTIEDDEKLHLHLEYRYFRWKFNTYYNKASFYDLFGPTMRSRKGWTFTLERDWSLIYEDPKFLEMDIFLGAYTRIDTLPLYQDISIDIDNFYESRIDFRYRYLESSQGYVDDEKGWYIGLTPNFLMVQGNIYPKVHASFDHGFSLPVYHSSIWFRSSIGYSFKNCDNPFSKYYFGGFGNNIIDDRAEKRYREYYSFPGTEINSLSGNNFGKFILELNLPPIRFSTLGINPLYVRWMRTSLFSSALLTDIFEKETRKYNYNIGLQIDFEIVSLSILKSYLSFGYAYGRFDSNNNQEFMISLKVF